MKAAIGCFIGLAFVVSASAEPLLEGRVRLDSGEPVADAQVRLFDLSDLRQGAIARAMTAGTGYFALPLAALTGQALPARFALGPNYPNPFNPSTIIPYQLAASSLVRLEVFNLLGQHIATLVDGERPAGFHTATWHATDATGRAVGAGVYIYRMTVGVERQTGRMVLVDGQAGGSAAGAASVLSGVAGGGSDRTESQVYGLLVSGAGLAPYVDSSFRVEAGMAPVELVVSLGHSGGKAADDDCAFCDLFDALNDDEEGPGPSGKVQATLEAPPAPTNLRFDAPTDSSCTVRWDAAAGATDYDVNYKPAVGGQWTNEPHRGIRLYNTIHDLEPGTEYRWAVRAENSDGPSEWVFGPNFTTLADETDETQEEEEETDSTSSEGGPDLIVQSASVNDNILTTEQAFILRARMQNQGTDESPEFVLSYYRSSNATITTRDTQVGTDEVGSLAASSIRNESIRLTASSTSGTYYYGACVASVSGESDTSNNCSTGVRVIVEADDTPEEEGADGDEILVFTDPEIYNDNVFVLPVTENLAAGNLPYEDYAARFYEHFNDEFDFLIFFQPPGTFSGAFYMSVKNDVQGIGLDTFSANSSWGSAGKLQGVAVHDYADISNFKGLLLHELMHRWGNFVVPITSYPYGSHWGLSTSGGYLDCYDISNWIDRGDGTFLAPDPFYFISSEQFSPIELYLAGFIPPEEVPDFQVAENGEPLWRWFTQDDKKYWMFTASGFKTYTIEDIIAEHGARIPDHSQAQKDFRAAVILLISEDYPATRGILETISRDVSWFSHVGEDESGPPVTNFYEATGGRGTITMDDLSHFQSRASAKRIAPSSFGTPPPPIVDIGNDRENLDRWLRAIPAEEE